MVEMIYTKWLLHKDGLEMELPGLGLYEIWEMRIWALIALMDVSVS